MKKQFMMKDPDCQQLSMIAALIYKEFGIYIRPEKYSQLFFHLQQALPPAGYSDMAELVSRLGTGDRSSFDVLAQSVTTGHTFFFREPEHFHVLSADIHEKNTHNTIIWCAACSSGEEAYSIVMTLLADGISDFHIVASDVNQNVLELFNRGIYHKNKLLQIPRFFLQNYFRPLQSDFFQIDPELRTYISIKNINIIRELHVPRLFDYVFCRNVFMYFDEKSCKQALKNIAANLKLRGLFFIGHGEILLMQPEQFKKAGSSVYCRTA